MASATIDPNQPRPAATSLDRVQRIDVLNFHTSPPPSLTARFNLEQVPRVPTGGSGSSRRASNEMSGYSTPSTSEDRSFAGEVQDPEGKLKRFIEHLLSPEHSDTSPHLHAIGYELEALISIYSASNVKLCISSRPSSFHPDLAPLALPTSSSQARPSAQVDKHARRSSVQWESAVFDEQIGFSPGERIRYEVDLPVWDEGDVLEGVEEKFIPKQAPKMRILVSLPPTYPNSSPPQLQLLGRYLGDYNIDAGLFGDITRTYITSSGVTFTPGDVCVFEGLTHVQSLSRQWYASHLKALAEGEKLRQADRAQNANANMGDLAHPSPMDSTHIHDQLASLDLDRTGSEGAEEAPTRPQQRQTYSFEDNATLPEGMTITSSDPIVDRRSTFIGHAVHVTDEKEVPLVIHELLSDKKIAKAAHPAIFAYRIAREVGGPAGRVIMADYDDDGESAAGSRLAHLLEILELENVLVVVSRWYGGTLLGADRFKHINQAARDALEKAGLLGGSGAGQGSGKGRRR